MQNDRPLSDAEAHESLQVFLQYCHTKTYRGKTIVMRPGDPDDRLHYIISGSVSVSVNDESGHQLILAYLNKNDFLGEIGVFRGLAGDGVREVTIKTRSQCQLAEITYIRLHQLLATDLALHASNLLYLLGEQLANRLLLTSRRYRDLAFMDVEGRVANTLLELCKQPDAITHPDGMQISITRQEISRIVGCSREMAGRVLKELEEKGLVSAYGKTIVVFGTR